MRGTVGGGEGGGEGEGKGEGEGGREGEGDCRRESLTGPSVGVGGRMIGEEEEFVRTARGRSSVQNTRNHD